MPRRRCAPRGDHAAACAPCLLAPELLSPNACFTRGCMCDSSSSSSHSHCEPAEAKGASHHFDTRRFSLQASAALADRGERTGMEVGAVAGKAAGASTSSAVAPFDRSSSRLGAAGAESFDGALKELKDLRSHLQEAADCCEKAFLNTEKKKLILESTKSYICEAVVAVIDHLGTVSSKLEHKLQEKTDVTQTGQKIDFLKQRLLVNNVNDTLMFTAFLFVAAEAFDLPTVCNFSQAIECTRGHRCYPTPSALPLAIAIQRSNRDNGASSSKDDPEFPEITSSTVSGATLTFKPYDVPPTIGKENTMATADDDESPKAVTRSNSSRAEDVHIILGDNKKTKASHASNILSFLKKTRRHA
ncbi:hypothetical protein ACP70R_036746 [Stipagrostis hirtigluma subsp. patula]